MENRAVMHRRFVVAGLIYARCRCGADPNLATHAPRQPDIQSCMSCDTGGDMNCSYSGVCLHGTHPSNTRM